MCLKLNSGRRETNVFVKHIRGESIDTIAQTYCKKDVEAFLEGYKPLINRTLEIRESLQEEVEQISRVEELNLKSEYARFAQVTCPECSTKVSKDFISEHYNREHVPTIKIPTNDSFLPEWYREDMIRQKRIEYFNSLVQFNAMGNNN